MPMISSCKQLNSNDQNQHTRAVCKMTLQWQFLGRIVYHSKTYNFQ